VRVLGDVTEGGKLETLREVDEIFINTIREYGLYDQIWQAFAVFLPVRSVGVQGDQRTHSYVVALRAVTSGDGMTADWWVLAEMAVLVGLWVRGWRWAGTGAGGGSGGEGCMRSSWGSGHHANNAVVAGCPLLSQVRRWLFWFEGAWFEAAPHTPHLTPHTSTSAWRLFRALLVATAAAASRQPPAANCPAT
jgi:hypothetical protein